MAAQDDIDQLTAPPVDTPPAVDVPAAELP